MLSLCEKLKNYVVYDNRQYKIKPTVARVLTVIEVLQASEFSDIEKYNICIDLLVKSHFKICVYRPDKINLLNVILKTITGSNSKNANEKKVIDFFQDADYIYTAFLQAYNIDLMSLMDKLDWRVFIAMLGSLPADTRLMQIIDIRTRDIPAQTKYNYKERARLVRLKYQYRLETTEKQRKEDFQRGLAKMAQVLGAMAKRTK